MIYIIHLHHLPILRLQHQQTTGAQTSLVILAHILYLVQIQLHSAALTLGERVGLALKWCSATVATDNFVFGHFLKSESPEVGKVRMMI